MTKCLIVINRVCRKRLEERRAIVKVFVSSRSYMKNQFAEAGWVMTTFMPINN